VQYEFCKRKTMQHLNNRKEITIRTLVLEHLQVGESWALKKRSSKRFRTSGELGKFKVGQGMGFRSCQGFKNGCKSGGFESGLERFQIGKRK
jgi:hypothetical protein